MDYEITEEEAHKILKNAFETINPLKLKVLPAKEKKKFIVIGRIAEQFETGKDYTEKEVNALLKEIYEDFPTLRRHLVDYGFLSRTTDCSRYWKN